MTRSSYRHSFGSIKGIRYYQACRLAGLDGIRNRRERVSVTFKQLRVAEDSCTQLNCLSVVVTGGENDKGRFVYNKFRIYQNYCTTYFNHKCWWTHTEPYWSRLKLAASAPLQTRPWKKSFCRRSQRWALLSLIHCWLSNCPSKTISLQWSRISRQASKVGHTHHTLS